VDKIGKNQIYRIITGIIIISIGIFLISLNVEFIVSSLVFLTGLTILISGVRYRARLKMKLEGEERNAYLRSDAFIVMLIGTIILLIGLVGGLIAINLLPHTVTSFWFYGIFIIGVLIFFAGIAVKAVDKTEKNP
jgi:amino acid transporter